MARNTEEQRYGDWIDRLDEAEKILQYQQEGWNRFLKYLRQDFNESDPQAQSDIVWINYQFEFSRIILPSIYFRNPDIIVESRRRNDPLGFVRAKILDHLINYQIEEIGFEEEVRLCIMDALYAYGVMKFGYAPALRRKGRSTIIDDMTFESLFEEEGVPELEKTEFEPDDRITNSNPFSIRVSPRYFLIDPLATSLSNARWVAHLVLKPIDEIKKSKLYPRGLTSGIEGTHRINQVNFLDSVVSSSAMPSWRTRVKEESDLVLLYEVWDKEEDKLIVLDSYNKSSGEHKFLREEDNPYPDVEGFPFEVLRFNVDPESFYPIPDASVWENPTEAMNLVNSLHYGHIKRFTRKYATMKGNLDAAEMEKLTFPAEGVVVQTNTPNPIEPIQDAPLTPDAYNLREIVRNELMSITGITEQKRGVVSKAKTATEAAELAQQSDIRDSDRLYIVSRFVEKCAKKILQLDRSFLTADYIAFVTSPEEAEYWMEASPEILKSEVDIKVRVGSSAFKSREIKTKQLLDAFNLFAQAINPMTGQPYINVPEFIKRIFEQFDIEDYGSLLAPSPMMPPVGFPPGPGSPVSAQDQSFSGGGSNSLIQSMTRRDGSGNLGDLMSGVQNLGVRRTPGGRITG